MQLKAGEAMNGVLRILLGTDLAKRQWAKRNGHLVRLTNGNISGFPLSFFLSQQVEADLMVGNNWNRPE